MAAWHTPLWLPSEWDALREGTNHRSRLLRHRSINKSNMRSLIGTRRRDALVLP